MYKVMIIEDEEEIRRELRVMLENALYETVAVEDFCEVEEQVRRAAPDIILMDVSLPGKDGITLCGNIRQNCSTPVIFLTGRSTAMDELNGMTMGGDDYITKPFYAPILLARIAAVIKRTNRGAKEGENASRITVCGCTLNLLDSTLSCEGRSAVLTKNECRICYCLFSGRGRIVPREEIMDDLWENHMFIDDNTLSVHVTHIRAKLKEIGLPFFIETKRGQGYLVPSSLAAKGSGR